MMYDIMSRKPGNTCDSVGRVYHAGEADIGAWNFCRGCSIRSRVSVFRVRGKKQATPYFDWCRLCALSGAVGIVCPCRAVVHAISVGWYGSDGITGRCSG